MPRSGMSPSTKSLAGTRRLQATNHGLRTMSVSDPSASYQVERGLPLLQFVGSPRADQEWSLWGLTFDLSGVPKARPLEGRVRHRCAWIRMQNEPCPRWKLAVGRGRL